MDGILSRRQLLTSLAASSCFATALRGSSSLETVPMYPDDSHSLYRVRMTIDVEGNAEVPKNAIVGDKVRKLGVKAASVIDYEERLVRDESGIAKAARRYYYEANTKGTVQSKDTERSIQNKSRRAVIQIVDSRAVVYAENGQLSSEELQLLRVPVNSLAIDRLLPYKSIKQFDSWPISDDVLANLFDMDAVKSSSVNARLTSFDGENAKFELSGRFTAAVDGVPTSIELRGKSTFDRKHRGISWLALALREDRDIGNAEPGFDVAAQMRIVRQTLPKPNAVKRSLPVDIANKPTDDKLMVEIESEENGFSVICDRAWRVMNRTDRITSMRMIDNDNVVAQCDVRAMPKLKDGHQLTLEAFQEDIQRTIGERFGEFIEAEEKLTGNELRLLRVVASGTVQDIPVQWVYLHFSDDSERRSAAIFTLADKQLDRFGGNDIQFAEGFRFIGEPAAEESPEGVAAASKTDEPSKTAAANEEESKEAEVATRPEKSVLQFNGALK